MLERSTGLKSFVCLEAPPRWRRTGSIGLLLLELGVGGCMTLGQKTLPPPTAESPPLPPASAAVTPSVNATPAAINISTPATVQPAKLAQNEKKRDRRATRASQIVSAKTPPAAHVSQEKSTAIDPGQLIGMAPGAVRQLLGPPLRVENYDLSREWVYASSRCSFRLFFYPNLNTAAFRVLKYGSSDGNGELIDVSDVCIRHILTARKNATG